MAGPAPTAEQLAKAKGQDAVILKAIPDRTQKVQAPEPIQPKQRLGPREKVVAAYRDRRAQTLDYAQKTTDDLRSRVGDSPLGPLDAYQWLLFTAAHNERHLGQIREVKADPKLSEIEHTQHWKIGRLADCRNVARLSDGRLPDSENPHSSIEQHSRNLPICQCSVSFLLLAQRHHWVDPRRAGGWLAASPAMMERPAVH